MQIFNDASIFEKARKVVESCETLGHRNSARRYLVLAAEQMKSTEYKYKLLDLTRHPRLQRDFPQLRNKRPSV